MRGKQRNRGGGGRLRRSKAFTLTELLMALTVIAILATIAYPSYARQLLKMRRVEAATELMQQAAALEKCFSINASYLRDADGDGTDDCAVQDSAPTRSGNYLIIIAPRAATRYTLTAQALASGHQRNDAACTSLSLTSTGGRTATGTAPESCW